MIRKFGLFAIALTLLTGTSAQERIAIPALKKEYPRMIDGTACRQTIRELVATPAGREAMQGIRDRLEPYVARHTTDPEWIVSRLQLFWQSHATDIYVDGETFDHAAGRAPVPTVRYNASRGPQNYYSRPRLEEVVPYQDSLGMWMRNRQTGQMEWADPRKAGGAVTSINNEIMCLARDAAFLYWHTGDERCARMASDLFDTFMTGLYYRNVPIDLNHGQQQTLVGLTSFEVIHENIAVPAAECYDFLHDYLARTRTEKLPLYEDAFRKWADNIIANGVPHNNWNLIQAQFVLRIALVLGDDANYPDGRGRQHYLNEILNESSIRQWSIGRLIDFGFDPATGLWKESPGYATMVLSEFGSFTSLTDEVLGIDLVAAYPVLALGVRNAPQYLFPNGLIAGWGDTHYGPLRAELFPRMISNARRHGKRGQEELFTALHRCFSPSDADSGPAAKLPAKVETFTSMRPLELDSTIAAGRIEEYVTPTFYSPEVSWFAARSGMDPQKSLMMSVCSSMGNHMHANGISLELYGKGYVMGPDLGRGSGYTTLDYLEFYSQFPAHNTVCVDGISSYPVMMAHHAFRLEGCYPAPEVREGIYEGVLYGDFSFLEPETQADQRRQTLLINTDPENGYYVDIFRSRRRDGQDRMHDYFYHNIGQEFTLDLATEPTEELAFAGGHLYAYSYLWDKHAADTDRPVTGRFTMHLPDSTTAGMRLWMRGERDRRIFRALSPAIDALTRTPMPYDVKNTPCQTFVARQYGQAWTRPFATVFEPYDAAGSAIDSVAWFDCGVPGTVGLRVMKRNGRIDTVFSSDQPQQMQGYGTKCRAVLAVVSDDQFFMARGTALEADGIRITATAPATVALVRRNGAWYYTADRPCRIRFGNRTYNLPASSLAPLR